MKCVLGSKKRRRIERLTGRAVAHALTRGGWAHGTADVWFVDGGRETVRYERPSTRELAYVEVLTEVERRVRAARTTMNTTVCADCGITYGIGSSPWCKDQHRGGVNSVEAVTWPGGKWFENLGHEMVRCDSPADLKRELKARNLEPMVRCVPGDQHTKSWATMDPYTMEAGRVLAERQAHTKSTSSDPGPSAASVAAARRVFQR